MPGVPAKVAKVYSGVVLDRLGFFANIIHPSEDLHTYGFQVGKIKHVAQRISLGPVPL
jgi:hypothetical protein